jgi:hypothetical protein
MHHAIALPLGIDTSWQKDACGYLASALVLFTFSVRSMRVLRCLGIASNVSFILYASITGMVPILILHSLLLPMNIYRLLQIARAQHAVQRPPEPAIEAHVATARTTLPAAAPAESTTMRATPASGPVMARTMSGWWR